VDQSAITGESVPVEKLPGSRVFSGSINQSGVLDIRTEGVGRDTAFGRILEAVERAEKSRAPIQKLADRLSGYLVYFALGCAALTYVITRDVRSTISVVIVAGACGIAAGTPLAILGAIGQTARAGVIVKGGRSLETLATVDTVVLDKTGTLTFGNPQVVEVCPQDGSTAEAVVEAAASAERPSEHAIAKAIIGKARDLSLGIAEPERFTYIPGKGIVCAVGDDEVVVGSRAFLRERGIALRGLVAPPPHLAEVVVARAGELLGTIRVADILRPEAVEAVAALKRMGLRTILLTGDATAIADSVAAQLAVDQVGSELLPHQKLDRVKDALNEGSKVAMVGDGINDAPALMQASVGVAMGSGTDVARESAEIVLLGNDLSKFVHAIRVARRAHRIIMTNFSGTLLVDGVGVGLAAFGFLNPLVAALIHVTSELAFILNSARLLPALRRTSATDRQKNNVRLTGGVRSPPRTRQARI
jgi:Cd2+/Zn2+-exporting ATPase/Cu+-exporting ATPase